MSTKQIDKNSDTLHLTEEELMRPRARVSFWGNITLDSKEVVEHLLWKGDLQKSFKRYRKATNKPEATITIKNSNGDILNTRNAEPNKKVLSQG